MSRRDHFGPQLQMFIPAGAFEEAHKEGALEFGDADLFTMNSSDVVRRTGIHDLKRVKIREARRGSEDYVFDVNRGDVSFYESVRRDGVRKPVEIEHDGDYPGSKTLVDGHRRVFAQADIDPNREVPVEHVVWDSLRYD